MKRLETCLFINNKLYEKSFLLVPIIYDNNFRVAPIALFVEAFNLSCWKSDNLKLCSRLLDLW